MSTTEQLIELLDKMSDEEIEYVLAYAEILAKNEDISSKDEVEAIRKANKDKRLTISHDDINWD